jgi:hypothetical protein
MATQAKKKYKGMTQLRTDDATSSALVPDSLLEFQYHDAQRKVRELEPERRLILAVLSDAVDCYQQYAGATDGRGKRIFHEAESWIFQEKDPTRCFSFEHICELFDLSPTYIRRGLKARRNKILQNRFQADARIAAGPKMHCSEQTGTATLPYNASGTKSSLGEITAAFSSRDSKQCV